MNEYLSKEKQKELKNLLNSYISVKSISTLKTVMSMMPQELYEYIDNNKRMFFEVMNKQIQGIPELQSEIYEAMKKGNLKKSNEIVKQYIDDNFKDEYEFICNFNLLQFGFDVSNFCILNNISRFTIYDVIDIGVDEFVSRYDKKNVDPELIKRTEIIKKNIDDLFQGVDPEIFFHAVREYHRTKQDYQLHNNLIK